MQELPDVGDIEVVVLYEPAGSEEVWAMVFAHLRFGKLGRLIPGSVVSTVGVYPRETRVSDLLHRDLTLDDPRERGCSTRVHPTINTH